MIAKQEEHKAREYYNQAQNVESGLSRRPTQVECFQFWSMSFEMINDQFDQ